MKEISQNLFIIKQLLSNLKKEIKENNLDLLKIRNEEDIKDDNNNIYIPEVLYFKKNSNLNLKMQNIKDNKSDSSSNNIYNKNVSNNNFLLKNINNQKKSSSNNLFNNFKQNIEKEIKNHRKNINKQEDNKLIIDIIKIKWYQFSCYYTLKLQIILK